MHKAEGNSLLQYTERLRFVSRRK